ncbi:hypothetical protein NM688_g1822 [Phlebia brevispora]|uniref:Uncharacterized protein n=1 Tax=Phlebia brevispora TaxID=194682 RepID=A0ACC1TAC4_9APHY|nr:hypothetical protein NM688_g1822 [Phlebia brevispora]
MEKATRMSRLSVYPRYAPRESVWAGSAELHKSDSNAVCSPFLRECVMAMEDCCDEAYEAQNILRQGTQDLPRITKVLTSERVFLLVDEETVRKYKTDLTDEIEPQVHELLSRAEKGLKILQKREAMLQSKVKSVQQTQQTTRSGLNTVGMNKLEARRIQMLARQRERLEEELAALQAEVDAMELSAIKKK